MKKLLAVLAVLMMLASPAMADTPVVGVPNTYYETLYPQDIIPRTTATYDLGSSSYTWAHGYFGAGTEAAPAVAIGPTAGFYSIGASNIGLSLGGTKKYDFGSNTFGIGVTPKVWYASNSVLQIGGKGALFTETTPAASSGLYIVENAYLDAGNAWKHIINDETARIQTLNGTLSLSAGAAGAADSAVTWEILASFALDGAATFYFDNVVKGFTTAQGWGIVTHTPANAGATGTAGTIAWDANFLYICSAANTWLRVAIATW